jgi:hypothetical protein
MQLVHITNQSMCSNPVQARCTWYNIIYKYFQWLVAGRWLFPGTPVSSTNKTDRHEITDILLKVALNTITITYFRSGAAIIVELSEWKASINLTIYQVHVGKTQYAKGKYLSLLQFYSFIDTKRIRHTSYQVLQFTSLNDIKIITNIHME